MARLSSHDKAVLNSIFNPNLPLDQVYDENVEDLKDTEENTPDVLKSKQLEIEAVCKADESQFKEALSLLNNALEIAPLRASLYNNRAQIHLLMGTSEVSDAFQDLSRAIELGENGQYKTLCQALCQRGLLFRKDDKVDDAKKDFQRAAKLGSTFAKNQLVELNPYAALCNQMLRRAFESL